MKRNSVLEQKSGEPTAFGYLVGFAASLVVTPAKIVYEGLFGPSDKNLDDLNRVEDFSLAPDGQSILVVLGSRLKYRFVVFDKKTRSQLLTVNAGNVDDSTALGFYFISHDEVLIVTSKSIAILDLQKNKIEIIRTYPHLSLADADYNVANKVLAISGSNGANDHSIRVYRIDAVERKAHELTSIKAEPASISLSPKGDRIAVRLTGNEGIAIFDAQNGALAKKLKLDRDSGWGINWIDDENLLVAGERSAGSKISELNEQIQRWNIDSAEKTSVFTSKFSPNFFLADRVNNRLYAGPFQSQIYVLDGNEIANIVEKRELPVDGVVRACKMSPDSKNFECLISRTGVLDDHDSIHLLEASR